MNPQAPTVNDRLYGDLNGGSVSPNSPALSDLQYADSQTSVANPVTPHDLITDLRNAPIANAAVRFMVAKSAVGDNLGGFYRWDQTSVLAEDTQYLNVVTSSLSTTGRWIRVFQKSKVFPQGILVNNGGAKSFYAPATTDNNGQVVINLTNDNTPTGTPLFAEVWQIVPQQNPTLASASAPILGSAQVSADLKTATCVFSQGNQQTLGSTLLSIVGTVIKGLAPVPSGVGVLIKIEGV